MINLDGSQIHISGGLNSTKTFSVGRVGKAY